MVSRVTLLVSGAVALLMTPAAAVMIWVFLPAFGPALPPLLVLLPGVVALSASKVVAGYITGINRPRARIVVSYSTLGVNIVANLILIPRFGIVGAAAASLVSYSSWPCSTPLGCPFAQAGSATSGSRVAMFATSREFVNPCAAARQVPATPDIS
jgi:O-antigen/teichoic acid export membrane protein